MAERVRHAHLGSGSRSTALAVPLRVDTALGANWLEGE
jgi:acetate kinase